MPFVKRYTISGKKPYLAEQKNIFATKKQCCLALLTKQNAYDKIKADKGLVG